MAGTNRVRWFGAAFVLGGIALTVAAVAVTTAELDGLISTAVALFIVAPPALVTVGIAMLVSPGEPFDGPFDFADWMAAQPRPRQLGFYAAGAVGLAIGAVLVLQLAGWSFSGLIKLVF